MPSMFTDDISRDNAQIRWCQDRCKRCNSIFTVTLLKNDIPIATKCMIDTKGHGESLYIYNKYDLKNII